MAELTMNIRKKTSKGKRAKDSEFAVCCSFLIHLQMWVLNFVIHLAIVSMSNLKCILFGLEIIQNTFNDLTLFFIAMQPVR